MLKTPRRLLGRKTTEKRKVTPDNSVEDLEMLEDAHEDKVLTDEEVIDMLS